MSNIINLIEEVTKNECDATWKYGRFNQLYCKSIYQFLCDSELRLQKLMR